MRIKISLVFFLSTQAIFGQVDFGAAQSIGLNWDNDVHFATDRYYTNGLIVDYRDPKLFKIFYKNHQTQKGLILEHKIYTPAKYNQDIPDFDRPFASSFTLAYYTKDLRAAEQIILTHQLQIGLQGRYSGGKTVQNFFHSLLSNSDEIEDWQFQMSTDLILNYGFELEKD